MMHQLSAVLQVGRRAAARLGWRVAAGRMVGAGSMVACAGVLAGLLAGGCTGTAGKDPQKRNLLDTMQKATIRIGDQPFEVWLALTDKQQELGLMQVTADQLAGIRNPNGPTLPKIERGMLFVFTNEHPLSFWMYNTITPLDIAYIAADGRIVKTYTMAPLETRIYPSIEPAQFALEVRAGLFSELKIAAGQHVEIPQSVLKSGS